MSTIRLVQAREQTRDYILRMLGALALRNRVTSVDVDTDFAYDCDWVWESCATYAAGRLQSSHCTMVPLPRNEPVSAPPTATAAWPFAFVISCLGAFGILSGEIHTALSGLV